MYFKLVEITEFDAIEGSISQATKQIIAVLPANSKEEAELIFHYLKRLNVLRFSNSARIYEAARDEFLDFIKGYWGREAYA